MPRTRIILETRTSRRLGRHVCTPIRTAYNSLMNANGRLMGSWPLRLRFRCGATHRNANALLTMSWTLCWLFFFGTTWPWIFEHSTYDPPSFKRRSGTRRCLLCTPTIIGKPRANAHIMFGTITKHDDKPLQSNTTAVWLFVMLCLIFFHFLTRRRSTLCTVKICAYYSNIK